MTPPTAIPAINPFSFAPLDKLVQPAILAALTEGPIHGYRLAERINEMVGLFGDKPDVSGVYRFLKKMEAAGLVVSTWEARDKGHAKRLYEIKAPSVPIMGETTASWFITVEGKEVEEGWRKQGCWKWKRRWRAERKEGVARLEFRPPPRPLWPRGLLPLVTES